MRRGVAFCIAGAVLAIGAVGRISLRAADEIAADPYLGRYVGTFHPKEPGCGACHAKATLSRADVRYILSVDVDYTPLKKHCNGKTNRVFVLRRAVSETNLVLRSKRYEATISGEDIEGRRLDPEARVRTVLQLKRIREPQEAATPDQAKSGEDEKRSRFIQAVYDGLKE